ncbi:MAG: hypothetical protein ABI959_07615 [Candidatus Dormiibacterota bacterium]
MVSDAGSRAAFKTGSLTVYNPLAVTQRCTQLCSVEEGCTVCGVFGGVSGGQGPYHYKITSDNRPTGMGVSGLTLTGPFPAPGALGAFDLTIQVSDAFGAKRTVSAAWYVFSHIAFSVSGVKCVGYRCSVQIPFSGGTPNALPTFKPSNVKCATPCTLPTGLSIVVSSGVVTVTFPVANWLGTFDLTLTDQSLCGPATTHCSTTVNVFASTNLG